MKSNRLKGSDKLPEYESHDVTIELYAKVQAKRQHHNSTTATNENHLKNTPVPKPNYKQATLACSVHYSAPSSREFCNKPIKAKKRRENTGHI